MPEIIRVDSVTGTWWCPICDHSMHRKLIECAQCAATRSGGSVEEQPAEPRRRGPGRPRKIVEEADGVG